MRSAIAIFLLIALFSCGTTRGVRSPRQRERDVRMYSIQAPDKNRLMALTAPYYLSEGIKSFYIHGDKDGAIDYFKRAIAVDSLYAPSYYHIAHILLESSESTEALEFSRAANRIDSANLTYKSQLARALVLTGHYDQAMGLYNTLIREDARNPLNFSMLAVLYDYNKQPFTAISVLDSAEYKLGRIEPLITYKRQLLINVRLYDKAAQESMALIADYPYDDQNYLVLAELYAIMGKDSLALDNYKEALRIDSTNMATLRSVGEFYKMRNNRSYFAILKRIFESEAMPVDEKAAMFGELTQSVDFYRSNYFAINSLASILLVKYPTEYSILDLYATHMIRSGELPTALGLYKSYVETNPTIKEPYLVIMDMESYLQRPDSVAKYSEIAISHFPDNTDLYIRRGFALDNLKNTIEALKSYRRAYRHADTDSIRSAVTGIIADMYHKNGQQRKSYRQYRKALKINPDNALVLNNYAYFLSEEGIELEKALAMSVKSNEITKGNATYLDTYAWILYKLGRYTEAKKVMLQAVSLDKTGSEVLLLHYGDILYKLKEYFMAKTYWRRALEKGYDPAQIEERLKWPDK